MKISVVKDILEANDRIADQNRAIFDEKGVRRFGDLLASRQPYSKDRPINAPAIRRGSERREDNGVERSDGRIRDAAVRRGDPGGRGCDRGGDLGRGGQRGMFLDALAGIATNEPVPVGKPVKHAGGHQPDPLDGCFLRHMRHQRHCHLRQPSC